MRFTRRVCAIFLRAADWVFGPKFGWQTVWVCVAWGAASVLLLVSSIFAYIFGLVLLHLGGSKAAALSAPIRDRFIQLTIYGASAVAAGLLPALFKWEKARAREPRTRSHATSETLVDLLLFVWALPSLMFAVAALREFAGDVLHGDFGATIVTLVLVSISVAFDVLFLWAFRAALRWISTESFWLALLAVALLMATAHALFWVPLEVMHRIARGLPKGERPDTLFSGLGMRFAGGGLALYVALSDALDLLLCYLLVALGGLLLLHRLAWWVVRHTLSRFSEDVLSNRKIVLLVGFALILVGLAPSVPELVKAIFGVLSV